MNKKGFTLVELIVVITIVAILSTVGFVAYTDYLTQVRDSNRLQQISSLHAGLELFSTRQKIPLSQDMVNVRFGSSQIGYQGDLQQSILDTIKYSDGGRDPKTKDFFSYFVSRDRNYSQVLAYFEDNNRNVITYKDQAVAIDNSEYSLLFPGVFGSTLGILIQQDTQIPIHKLDTIIQNKELDLQTNTGLYTSFLTNQEIIKGEAPGDFTGIVPYSSCENISTYFGIPESRVYKINPSGVRPINVYCEMDVNNKGYGDGWLLIARTSENSPGVLNFGWLYNTGDIYDNQAAYSLGEDIKDIRFSEIMFATYDTDKNITSATIVGVNQTFFSSQIGTPQSTLSLQNSVTTDCEMIYNEEGFDEGCYANYKYWGAYGYQGRYVFNRQNTTEQGFVYPHRFDTSNNGLPTDKDTGGLDPNYDNYRGNQGMIFVR